MPAVSNRAIRVIDPILTNVAQGYANQEFVGSALFPRVPVFASGGQIIEFGREAFRRYVTKRSPGGNTKRIQLGHLGKPFALLQDALEATVPREHLRDASQVPGIDLAARAVNVVLRNLSMSLEIEQAALATTLANYPVSNRLTLAGATKWTTATGVPMTDIDTGREAVRQQCGMYPNTLLFSAVGFNACKNNVSVLDRLKYNGYAGTDASQVTPQMLAGLFNVERVVVGKGIFFSDADVSTDIWGNCAVLAYVPATANTAEEPSYGYTYAMEGHPLVEVPYWDDSAKSWIYGVTYERVPVLSGITSGYFIQNPA